MQRVRPERIRQMNAQFGTAGREMKNLPHGGVLQVGGRQHVLGFGNLLRCSP